MKDRSNDHQQMLLPWRIKESMKDKETDGKITVIYMYGIMTLNKYIIFMLFK